MSALAGIRVVELHEPGVAYAGRLLADLGAEVVLVEPPGGGEARATAPLADDGFSLWHAFHNAGKKGVTLDLGDRADQALLERLVAEADVVLAGAALPDWIAAAHPAVIFVSVTPFGEDGPFAELADGDLVALATGGLLHLGGYEDAGPVAVYGGQSRYASGLMAAVAALLGLLGREQDGGGARVDVSTQESVALALEDSLAEFALNRRVRTRLGESPREAGTGTYRCADGHVAMVAGRLSTGRAWGALVQWLAEERAEGAERLLTPEWQRFEHRRTPAAREAFRAIFETFAAGRTKEELYREGQRRSIAIAPVNTVAEVLADPQLEAREAFVQVEQPELGRSLSFPVPPYRLSRTPARITGPAPALGQHNAELLREVA